VSGRNKSLFSRQILQLYFAVIIVTRISIRKTYEPYSLRRK